MKFIAVYSGLFSKVVCSFLSRLHKTPHFLYKKRVAILCGFLVLAQLASPSVAVIIYAASTTSNQVGSSAALDPVGNKVSRLQTQGSSGVDQSTGAFMYSYPLTIPDGRNGMSPKLALSYNSQNNDTGWFGYGWTMSIPYIDRTTKTGTDKLYTSPAFVSFLHGELISSNGTSYEQKIDDGSYAKYTYTGNTWQMTDRDGTTYYFGNTYESRVQDDAGTKIGRWYLSEVKDKFGNGIVYTYTKDSGTIYPNTISYTEHALAHPLNLVTFNLENKNDKTISYKYGFKTTDTKRVSYIKTSTNGRDNAYFSFNYTTGSNGVRSLLQFVEERHLGTNDDWDTLPKTYFEYENSPIAFGGSISASVNPYGGNSVIDTNNDGILDLYSAGDGYYAIDINGDYKKDLMQADMTYGDYSPNHFINFKYNNGAGFNLRSMLYQTTPNNVRYMITGSVAPPLRVMPEGTGVYGQESVIVDLNGDGFDDIMYNDQYGGNGVGINTTNNSFNYPQASGLATSIADTLVDINGDGLTDKIVKSFTATSTLFTAFLNNGTGYEATSTFAYDAKIAQSGFDIGVRFVDVNNDGLIDVVRSYTSNYTSNGPTCSTPYSSPVVPGPINQSANEIAINTGSSFTVSSTTLSGYLISYETCSYDLTPNFLVTKTSKEYDTNGDQTTDYDGITNNTIKQDVLKKVTTPLGSTLDVSYTWTTKTGLNPTLPVPMYIVATTTDKLSVSDQNPHAVGYGFYGGQMYFDVNSPRDHKFAGFGKVNIVDGKNKTTTYYHQGNGDDYVTGEKGDSYYNIGRSYRTDTFDLSTGTSTLVTKNLSLYTTYSYASSSFTYLDSQVSSIYNFDGSFLSSGNMNVYDPAKRLIKTSYSYGDIESFTSFASSTIIDKGADVLATQYQYSNSRPQRLVKQVTTDYSGNTVGNTSYYYDNLPLGLVDKGAVTSVYNTIYKDGGTVSSTSTTQTVYDATGNVIQTADNLNHKTNITYDSSYLFPVTKVDALNGTTTFTYDPYTLNLLTTKGPDGITYVKETDGQGKTTRTYTINNGGGISDEVKTSYVYGGGLSVYSRKLGITGTSARSFQAYDSYGRLIQSKSETTPDVFSTQDTIYDASSNVISTSLPYTTTGYGLTGDTPSNGNTIYTYDGLGRVTAKSSFGTTLSYQYGARSLVVQDNASTQHKKSYAYDANGNLSQVNEYNGGTAYTTNYTYTPFNKLSRIVDANGNIRNFSYLTNGSLTYQEDPHAPADTTFTTYSYTYDSLGNLTTKSGQLGTTTYAYDALNRPTSRTLSDVNYGTSTVGIIYTGCINNYSSPCTINRQTSSTTLEYNVSGKLSSESLSIDGNIFTRSYAYDTFGNPATITYPDNGKTVYTYTLDGKQSTLSYITPSGATKNIVTNSTYNSLGALSSLSFDNGVKMCNTYTNTSADGTISPKLAKSSYLFNTTGCSMEANQIELYKDDFTYKDNITPSSVLSTYKDIAGVTHTKSDTFTYDNLARLTQVTTSYDGGAAVNDVLTYDPIGNILKENDVLYRYSQDGTQNAHAVTSVGGMHVAYDAQGNRIQVGDSAYAWNALNQMVSATSTNGTEIYTYDENGERIKKVIQATSPINQKATPSTSSSTLSGFRSGDLLAQVTNGSTYIATSTYNTLSSLSLLGTGTLTTLVSDYYSSPFTSKFCATATSTTNRQNCIVTTTQQLLANNINSRGTSTVATTGLVDDVINIVTGAYLIPSTYTGLATSSIATSATSTFSINSGTISSYNTYVATGVVVPMAEYANLPYVSSSTYGTLAQVGLTDTSKVRALLTLAGCNSVTSACTTAEKVVFERTYKNSGYLLSDKVLQEMWYVFAAKARLPGSSSEFTATSTTLGTITIPTVAGLSASSATSTYYSGLYFTTEYTNQNASEPRLQFFNTIPYYVTQSAFTELQQAGITQTTIENYQALIGDLFGIKTSSSTEYMAALNSFTQYDKKVTLSYNAIKELYFVALGAATIPNNVSDYTATSIFDLTSYLTINSYQYNGYTGTWPLYASGCYAGYYTGSGSTPWARCVITASSFTLPVATSSTISYILTVSKTPQPTEWPLVVGNSVSISGGINQTYTSTTSSDGSHLDVDVSPTIVARLAGSTSTVMVANSHEFVTGSVYPYQAESVVLKAYVSTPRLTLASTTLVSSISSATTSEYTVSIQSSIASYFGEIYDSSDTITLYASSSPVLYVSLETYNEFASTTLKTAYDISKIFLATTTSQECIDSASTTECDKQVREVFFRQTVGNLSGFIPSQAATEEFWMVHKGKLSMIDNYLMASTTYPGYFIYTPPPYTDIRYKMSGCFNMNTQAITTTNPSVQKDVNGYFYQTDPCSGTIGQYYGNNQSITTKRYVWVIGERGDNDGHYWSRLHQGNNYNGKYFSQNTHNNPAAITNTFTVDGHTIRATRADLQTTPECIGTCNGTYTNFLTYMGNYGSGGRIYGIVTTDDGNLNISSQSSLYGELDKYYATTTVYVATSTVYSTSTTVFSPTSIVSFSRSNLPQTLSTSTATTSINLTSVPSGLLNDTQFRSIYSTSTFAQATTTKVISSETYNELLYTPIRINSDVDNIFNYALPYATSTCSGQSATSTCVTGAQKLKVKDIISASAGFTVSDSALEELYRVYSGVLSIIPVSLVYASTTETQQSINVPLDVNNSFITSTNSTASTTQSIGNCSFGTVSSTSSVCSIVLPHINTGITSIKLSYTFATSSISTSTLVASLTQAIPLTSATSTGTSTVSFATTSTSTLITGQKSSSVFTFDVTSIYEAYEASYNGSLILQPNPVASSTIYSVTNPVVTVTRKIAVPHISYDGSMSSVAFMRNTLGMATSTATTTVDLTTTFPISFSTSFLSPVGKIPLSANTQTSTTTTPEARLSLTGCFNMNTQAITQTYPSLQSDTNGYFYQTDPCSGTIGQYYGNNQSITTKRYVWVIGERGDNDGHYWSRLHQGNNYNGKYFSQNTHNNPAAITNTFTVDGHTIRATRADLQTTPECIGTCNGTYTNFLTYMGNYGSGGRIYGIVTTDDGNLNISSQSNLYSAIDSQNTPVGGTSTAPLAYSANPNTDTNLLITYVPLPITIATTTSSVVVYPTASTTQIATGTIALITQATTTQFTTYTPFSNYVSDSRGFNTTYFTLNGVLVGAYSYQIGNESGTAKLTFAHTNYLGTPVLETDDKGDIVQMDITDVFGNYVQRDQRMDNAYHTKGYIGQEYDDVTNLSYLHARYLDTTSHSFMSVDPLIYSLPTKYLYDPQQMNSYMYARGNPVVYSDPSGLSIWSDIKDAVSGFLNKASSFFSPTTSSSNSTSQTKKPADVINQSATTKQTPSVTNSQNTTKTTTGTSNNFSSYNTQFASVESSLAGKPYVRGANGPDAVDCSGAVVYGIRQTANKDFSDRSANQLYKNYSIPTDSRERGTVTFYDYTSDGIIDHVTTNVGDGQMLNPLSPERGVKLTPTTYLDSYTKKQGGSIYHMQLDWQKINQ